MTAKTWLSRKLRAIAARLDEHAPRLTGFSVDEGLPPGGQRYGGVGTIHNTGTVDIMLTPDGDVAQVWFRCRMLPFCVSDYRRDEVVADPGVALVAVELVRTDQ